jgi:hypothetical protein
VTFQQGDHSSAKEENQADPTQISPWPASHKFGGKLWANSAHGGSFAGCAGS